MRSARTDIELEILHEVKALRCEVAALRQEVAAIGADVNVIRVEVHQIHKVIVPGPIEPPVPPYTFTGGGLSFPALVPDMKLHR
jgi:hypothetical protein